MDDSPHQIVAIVARIGTPGQPAFQLRKGEEGLSVFDPFGVEPPLTEEELLEPFRTGSIVLYRTVARIIESGLIITSTFGSDSLPDRLRKVHREIVPAPGMSRPVFKAALKLLE